jgi:hypothetical protein
MFLQVDFNGLNLDKVSDGSVQKFYSGLLVDFEELGCLAMPLVEVSTLG